MIQKRREYNQGLTTVTREELIGAVSEALSDKRFQHVLRVEETGLALAEKYGANPEKVSIACLLHDIAKEASDEKMRDVIINESLSLEMLPYGNAIWHGPVAAVIAQNRFGVDDQEILDAISNHTFGDMQMSLVEKIVYVADYIEPGRDFPGVEKARALAEEQLDAAIAFASKQTLQMLIEKNQIVYPQTIITYNAFIDAL